MSGEGAGVGAEPEAGRLGRARRAGLRGLLPLRTFRRGGRKAAGGAEGEPAKKRAGLEGWFGGRLGGGMRRAAEKGRRAAEKIRAGRAVGEAVERAAEAAGQTRRNSRWFAGRPAADGERGRGKGGEPGVTRFNAGGVATVISVLGQPWMTGISWHPELESKGAVLRKARDHARHVKSIRDPEVASEMEGVDDVLVLYDVGGGRVAWGMGSSREGHEGGMASLAAQVHAFFAGAEQEKKPGVRGWSADVGFVGGFDVPGGGHYVTVWKGSVPFAGTDRVYRDPQEAVSSFVEKVNMVSAVERGWLIVAPAGWSVQGVVDAEVSLEEALAGRIAAVGRSWKGELARLGRAALVCASVLAVGWSVYQVAVDVGTGTDEARARMAQMRVELRGKLRELVPLESYGEIYRVERAPWETGPGPASEHAIGVCTSLVRNARVALGAAELGRSVSRLVCVVEGLDARVEVETVPVLSMADPAVLRRQSGVFSGLEQRQVRAVGVAEEAAGADWYGGFPDAVRRAPGGELVLEKAEISQQLKTARNAWALAWFAVITDVGLDSLPTLREVLSRDEVVVAEVSFLVREAAWEVKGWIAAETPVLAEVRAQEAESERVERENARLAVERGKIEKQLEELDG